MILEQTCWYLEVEQVPGTDDSAPNHISHSQRLGRAALVGKLWYEATSALILAQGDVVTLAEQFDTLCTQPDVAAIEWLHRRSVTQLDFDDFSHATPIVPRDPSALDPRLGEILPDCEGTLPVAARLLQRLRNLGAAPAP